MKPDWSSAPAWAKYLSMDEDGTWYWYENAPEVGLSVWKTTGGMNMECGSTTATWSISLEGRP